jgi:bifunctional non-homologous end joining protein LigD
LGFRIYTPATDPPREKVVHAQWVDPVLVGEVRSRQFNKGAGRLRQTSCCGLCEGS